MHVVQEEGWHPGVSHAVPQSAPGQCGGAAAGTGQEGCTADTADSRQVSVVCNAVILSMCTLQ